MTRLKSKRALVTAAGQGIGRAIGEAFLAEGASIFAVDHEAALLGAFDLAIVHDLTAAGAAEAIFAQTGRSTFSSTRQAWCMPAP